MAKSTRLAKPANHWIESDPDAFNIQVVTKNADEFFGRPLPEQLDVSPVILNNLDEPSGASNADSEFFACLEETTVFQCNRESFVVDFVTAVLRHTGYSAGDWVIHTRREIPFEMCGETVGAMIDVCVMERGRGTKRFLMVVQEDKRHLSGFEGEPEPQLIADAIAAFSWNNFLNRRIGLPTVPEAVIPGITIRGSAPIFYKIPVSEALVEAITTAQYPPTVTTVERLVPPVPDRRTYQADGMKPLENRRIVFQCFQGLKALVHNVYR